MSHRIGGSGTQCTCTCPVSVQKIRGQKECPPCCQPIVWCSMPLSSTQDGEAYQIPTHCVQLCCIVHRMKTALNLLPSQDRHKAAHRLQVCQAWCEDAYIRSLLALLQGLQRLPVSLPVSQQVDDKQGGNAGTCNGPCPQGCAVGLCSFSACALCSQLTLEPHK